MDIRYSANPQDVKRYTTEELRREFLIESLFRPGELTAVYSHVDRMVTMGCMPAGAAVSIEQGIDVWASFGTQFFLERREAGLFNLGGPGRVTVDGTVYPMDYKDCLYITGARRRSFSPAAIPPPPPSSTSSLPPPTAAMRRACCVWRTRPSGPAATRPCPTGGSSTSSSTPTCCPPASSPWA